MNTESIIKLFEGPWEQIREAMCSALASDIPLLEEINSSLLENGGKQLRPLLMLLIARSLGVIGDDTVRYAAAIELLHNATLLHDDVADSSSVRRGKPTLSATRGPAAAVLTGDYWLAKAVGLLLGTGHQNEVIPLYAKILSDLSEGEMFQMEKAGTAGTAEDDYYRIIYCKTASVFEASCRIAAISVDASAGEREAAAEFGRHVGLAFQIVDDVLDYSGSDIGKPVGTDLRERKITMPLLCALQGAPAEEQTRIRSLVATCNGSEAACEAVRSFVQDKNGTGKALERVHRHVARAMEALDTFPASESKSLLLEYARFLEVRTK